MIFFSNSKGTITNVITEPVYQGSNNVSEIVLVAPFPSSNQVQLNFVLPNGITLTPKVGNNVQYMTDSEIPAEVMTIKDEYGTQYNIWYLLLDNAITEYSGSVTVQFVIYSGTGAFTTASTTFNVIKGVPVDLPSTPTNTVYAQILNNLATLSSYVTSLESNINAVENSLEELKRNVENNYQPKTDDTLDTDSKEVVGAINEVNAEVEILNEKVLTLADGKQAIAFSSYSAMITALNSYSASRLLVGQDILFIQQNIPDLWVSGIESTLNSYVYTTDEAFLSDLESVGFVQVGYYRLSALETKQQVNVDLTEYQKKVDETLETESKEVVGAINEINGKLPTIVEEKFLVGTAEPTTETVAPSIGALYVDTTNNATYQCTAIDTETPSYTWVRLIRATDYASNTNYGVVRTYNSYGVQMYGGNFLATVPANDNDINTRDSSYKPITPKNMDYAFVKALTTNENDLTEQEKASAQEWLGIGSGGSWQTASFSQVSESSISLENFSSTTGTYFITGYLNASPVDGDDAWYIPVNCFVNIIYDNDRQMINQDISIVYPIYKYQHSEPYFELLGYVNITTASGFHFEIKWNKPDNSYYEFENITGVIKYQKID